MIKSSITINLVKQIKTGPWIYWEPLNVSLSKAAMLGFNGVELYIPSADEIDIDVLLRLLLKFNLQLSAIGTGAGKLLYGLSLTNPDEEIRKQAVLFIKKIIAFGAHFGAPSIIGSMQGNVFHNIEREQSIDWLATGLGILGVFAEKLGVTLIFEPLNRYETNLINRLDEGVKLINSHHIRNLKLLADLFHMNIEETSISGSIRNFGKYIGYIHFADSNRYSVGKGHIQLQEIANALLDIKYKGYISAEAFPFPDSDNAAKTTIETFNKYFKNEI